MEKLHDMLVEYNTHYVPINCRSSWSKQFMEAKFPKYWEIVFKELYPLDKNLKVIEIGCGQGDVTSILCYLGFYNVRAYEMDSLMSKIAANKIEQIFGRTKIVMCSQYPALQETADILILVNCAYADGCSNKEDYLRKLVLYFDKANRPKLFLLEVIDSEYKITDKEFPDCLRLNSDDIKATFPQAYIYSYITYKYPQNKRTKKLYIIRHTK